MAALDNATLMLKNMGREKADAYLVSKKGQISTLAGTDRAMLTSAYANAFLGWNATPESFSIGRTVPPAPVVPTVPKLPNADTMDTSTGAPVWMSSAPIAGGYSHDINGAGYTFTPTKAIANGVNYNDQGKTDQERFGLTSAQKNAVVGYAKQLSTQGVSEAEKSKLAGDYIALLQKNNQNTSLFGTHSGSNRGEVPTDPTKEKGTIGSLVDINGDGIPDSQQGFGVEGVGPSSSTTGIKEDGTPVTFDDTYWSKLEKDFNAKNEELTNREIDLERRAQDSTINVKNENARRVIDAANSRIGQISDLLDEQIVQNQNVYESAVGDVYRQLGGQVKQFQRLIGSDGKAIDDATMLALTGELGVTSMSKIIDLKNNLAQIYLDRKAQSQKDIYKLVQDKIITQGEAAEAVNAINILSEKNILNMTKNFYDKMFSTADAIDARSNTNQTDSRAAVSQYMTALGLSAEQQTQLLNNYVAKGFTPEQAVATLSEDIRDGKTPIPAWMIKNTKEAQEAALLKFNQEQKLQNDPIILKWQIARELQDDKQAFEAEQNALDRKLKAAGIARARSSWGSGAKPLTLPVRTNVWSAALTDARIPQNIWGWSADTFTSVRDSLARISRNAGSTQDQANVNAHMPKANWSSANLTSNMAVGIFNAMGTPTSELVALDQ